ncbi:MAG: hypothetical protein KAT06_07535 [Gammaproteobacteria bacterium]|nr:hypothetical protein [Gammaproteobacteria bacterium]
MDFKRTFTPKKTLILVLGILLNLVSTPFCFAISAEEAKTLEKDYQSISNKIYAALGQNLSECQRKINSIKELNHQLQEHSKQNQNAIGQCLIKNNLSLIKKNIDNKTIFPVFQFLLDNNNLLVANRLYTYAKNEADKSLISNISFIYARYYLKRKKWKKVLQYTEDTYTDLSDDDANLARLFTGIAMQKVKLHRRAVNIYSKIPQQSKYYPAARLNIATAYIRQDWWTDAHIKINEILNPKKNNNKIKVDREMINRLYLVLGYSLLNKEFYRDSREAFRNIEVNSQYFNKALLGIVLTSTNQEDYIGALNAVNILKAKKTFDLSVDESHLLLPYIYEKLNQNMTASASYSDAQKHYQERIKNISALKNNVENNINVKEILANKNHVNIKNNIISFSNNIPVSFLKNSSRIEELSNYSSQFNNMKLRNDFSMLKNKYKKLLSGIFNELFEQRLTYLNSYMNQSRFGLARLFDNSNTASN